MDNFKSSGIFTKQAHVDIPKDHFEEEHGRKGFFGRVSHLYHQNPPVGWTKIQGELRPRLLPPVFDKLNHPELDILYNNDVIISLGLYQTTGEAYQRNADGDDLFFIHAGCGVVETTYGKIPYSKGDYIVIPRGTTYKFFIQEETKTLRVQSLAHEYEQPDRGLLGPNALYDQTAIFTPEASLGSEKLDEYRVDIKRNGEITSVTYPFNPLDVSGWKGSLYPWKLSIYDYCPVMSHRYHIPPSGHTTFLSRNFVVCSFVARPLEDSEHKVLKVPFYHSNIDFDEVLFYHQGNFFSRDNIAPGALTFHPQGIHHGPHPKAFAKADTKTFTDEFAVMVDTRFPLHRTPWFKENEFKDYWKSWQA
jgi:homogentisate 1,2-dioxygenase